jgi:hypothetical protein
MHGHRQRFLPGLLLLLLAVTPSMGGTAPVKLRVTFMEVVASNFYTWDRNQDQTLSVDELDFAIKDPGNTGPEAAALAALKRAARATNYTLPPLTLDNIRELAGRPPTTNQPNMTRLYNDSLRRINSVTNRQLFASGLPRLETIHQGHMGDCFCLAPLGAMVYRDPQEVASMFSVQDERHIIVRIGSESVVVAPPTDAEWALAMMANNGQDGLWVDIYEEAIGQLRNNLKSLDQQSNLSLEAIASGGSAGKIITYLTCHKVSSFSLKFGKDPATTDELRDTRLAELRQKLASAIRQKRLVACSTFRPTTPGLSPRHVYALLEYDAKGDTLELWNPHGNKFDPKGPPGLTNGYSTKNGVFTIPIPEFVQQFSGMAFEGTELAARQ